MIKETGLYRWVDVGLTAFMLECIIWTKPPHWKKNNPKQQSCSFNERYWKWVEQKTGLPAHLGSQHWFVLLVQSCHAALPTGFKGRAVMPCFPSAGSEQLQPRGHRRLQAAGSQRALGGRGLHHHRPRHHRHLLRGSLHNGEQELSQPSLQGLQSNTLTTATVFIYFGMLSKRIFSYLKV